VNGDGNLDLAILNPLLNPLGLSVLPGNGNGTFRNPQNTVQGYVNFVPPVFGDINGDGKLDFVTADRTDGLLSIEIGNGDGTFQAPTSYAASDGYQPALGDFNGDGKMDVASFTANSSTVNLSIFLQGTFPIATVAPITLNFTEAPIGQNASQPVTLTNTGNETLTISNIGFTGSNAADFSQTNNCATSLAASASCTVNIKFTSQGGGLLTASLAITDNAPGSPQTVPITATSPDFSIKANTATSVTVSPGQTATYGITIAAVQNFVGSVTLSCTGGPPGSNCTVVPGNAAVEAPVTATVTVTTPASAAGMTNSPNVPPFQNPHFLIVVALFLLPLAGLIMQPRRLQMRRIGLSAIMVVLIALGMSSCGGGGGGGGTTGTYTVNVTGTYSSNGVTVTHSLKLTLGVQQ
jgi:hypothetical protein